MPSPASSATRSPTRSTSRPPANPDTSRINANADTTAPAATQITPYVDGQPVAYAKTQSGAGAPAFANSTLFFMSRGGASLFGAGALDEVAIYDGALSAATVAEHYADGTP